MGNWLSQTYPGEAPRLTEKNLPNQAGKVGGISIITICDQKVRKEKMASGGFLAVAHSHSRD
jgi:hypothetical protein